MSASSSLLWSDLFRHSFTFNHNNFKEQIHILTPNGLFTFTLTCCVCVFWYMLHTEDYNTHFSSKVRTFSGVEDMAAAPYKSKGIHWDQVKVQVKGAGLGDWEM